ncbi:hypothetical protein NPS01_35240 [Nocardioides psychrotolerans]|uniref:Uncharacterized protein n=1 Tax=Nocardioides psychrotolerans TaxID=1005945 RepID=A0A1I3PTR9_9ACTN|nr:hypothetical protein [Nocardioides psychrotolerans]GEP39861.1 hypothetical protein NPS01_35240 [Nocardioides psychrotolerans]SFJ25194.1 hypothetical protein SAMN05216561_12220 [Nocardioides psychrotolerans]
MNLTGELERSFGDGPAPRPVDDHLSAGRGALRRRRGLTGAVAAAAGAVALTVVLSVTGGTSPDASPDVAADPTPTPTAETTPAAPPSQAPWTDEMVPIRYRDGEFEVRLDAVVHERVDNPFDYEAPQASAALDVTFEGRRAWVIATLRRSDGQLQFGYSESVPSNGWASFADYVADQADLTTGGNNGWPETLVLTDIGEVVAGPGSEVLQRTDDPQLGATFAGPGEPTGAAIVTAAEDGQGYFVVWRVVDGDLDVIYTPPIDVVGNTFEELLSYARSQYAGGEGLR